MSSSYGQGFGGQGFGGFGGGDGRGMFGGAGMSLVNGALESWARAAATELLPRMSDALAAVGIDRARLRVARRDVERAKLLLLAQRRLFQVRKKGGKK